MRNAPATTTAPGVGAPAIDHLDVLLLERDDGDAHAIIAAIARDAPGWTVSRDLHLADALATLGLKPPDIIVADLAFTGSSPTDIVDRLIQHDPLLALVIVNHASDDHVAVDAIQRGAEDCLTRVDLDGPSLVRAMRHAVTRTRLRAAVARREARYHALTEGLAEGVLVQDAGGRILDANRAASRILRKSVEEIVTAPPSTPTWDALRGDGSRFDPRTAPGRTALETGEVQRDVVMGFRQADGTTTWIEANAAPVLTSDRSDTTDDVVIVSFRDITERREAEAEISFKSRLLELAGQAIVATDPDGVVLYWNPAAADLYGWRPEEVMGCPIGDLVHPSGDASVRAEMGAVLDRGDAWTGEHTVTHRDGSVLSVLVSNTPMFDDHGKLMAIVGLSADISARKAAEAASGRLSAIVDGSHDAIIGSTLEGIVTSWNPAAEALFDFSPDEAIGRHVSLIAEPDRVGEVHANIDTIRQGGVVSLATVRTRKDGSSVEVWLTVSPVRDGDGAIVGASAILRDMTELVTQERASTEQRRLLAESEAMAELEAAQRRTAEQANEAKNRFLSRMSHELRTPLNAVIGFSQLLQRQSLDPEDDDAVTQIHRAGRHLLDLINDVLDVSRVEAGELSLSVDTVNLAEVCRVAVVLIDPARRSHGVTISVSKIDPEVAVQADRRRVEQIVVNLLANAVKYNTAGGRVDITTQQVDARTARLSITDTGPGIAREDLARVFMPFERLGAERTGVEGTGMGLTLCQSLAREMGGAMGVESTPGCGSTFWVDLPYVDGVPSTPPSEPTAAIRGDASSNRRSVLYIEDNLPSRRLVQRALEDHGTATVISAEAGLIGFEMAKRLRPSLILLDLHLPDINGAHVLALLRAEASTEDIPVVIVSADATHAQRDRLLRIGATDYLTKPVDLTALAQLVDRLLC